MKEWSPWVIIRILCPWVNSRYFIIIIVIIIIININIIKIKRLITVCLILDKGMKSLVNIRILCPWVNSSYFIIIIIIIVVVVVVVVNIIKIKRLITVCLILDEVWGMKSLGQH